MSGKTDHIIALAATLGASALTRKAVEATWKVGAKGKAAPSDPTDPDVELREAIVFAVLSGVAMSVARLFIARKFAKKERREARVEKAVGR